MRSLIAIFKIFIFLLLCLFCLITQGIVHSLFRNASFYRAVPTFFCKTGKAIFRIKTTIRGDIAPTENVIYVANHISDMDIPVLGSILPVSFISKADVRNWPIFGQLASINKTVYIERSRDAVQRCIKDIDEALEDTGALILFPEGTSTDGSDVIPFKSSLFELFLSDKLKDKLMVQPVTITLTHTNGKPVQTIEDRDIYGYYGDIEMLPHIWNLAKSKGAHLIVDFMPPHHAKEFDNRKEFANACHKDVSDKLKGNLKENTANALDFADKVA